MKLTAIYNTWGDWDLLKLSVKNIQPLVDEIIVVCSEYSNYGERDTDFMGGFTELHNMGCRMIQHETHSNPLPVMLRETQKRNIGIAEVRKRRATHFLMLDADEFYEASEFLKAKESFKSDLNGLVCASKVYFKSPKLTIGYDTTLVPFIHKMTHTIQCSFNYKYPFAWQGDQILIDPTRSFNINSGVELCDVTMHHMSWIRKDFEKKIRNSTARKNIEASTIRHDLVMAKEGYYCEFYRKPLVASTVDFGIPDELQDLQPIT